MNVVVFDAADAVSDFGLEARVRAVTGRPGAVCRVAVRPAEGWLLRFGAGAADIVTRQPPEGGACAVLLTCDHFGAADELAVLDAPPGDWAAHLARLDAARPGLDVFVSFGTDAAAGLDADPELEPLLRLAGVGGPGLAWYRTAGHYYEAAKRAVRKDARAAGQFTVGSVLRELVLGGARVGVQGDYRGGTA